MSTQTIDAMTLASVHPDIVKRTSVSGLILSCIMVILGVFAFVSIFQLEDRSSSLSMALMVFGAALLIAGVVRLFWKSKHVVYLPTGSIAKEESLFFDLKDLNKLLEIVKSGSFTTDTVVKGDTSGNIRMDVILTEDTKFAAVQLFQFVPYTYNPVTSVCYYTDNEASELAAFLKKCKVR